MGLETLKVRRDRNKLKCGVTNITCHFNFMRVLIFPSESAPSCKFVII